MATEDVEPGENGLNQTINDGKPTILQTIRFTATGTEGTASELFEPGQEDELADYLEAIHGDGDEEKKLKSKDEVLEYLTKKGMIVNFVEVDELFDHSGNVDQRVKRTWKKEQAERQAEGEEAPAEGEEGATPKKKRSGKKRTALRAATR